MKEQPPETPSGYDVPPELAGEKNPGVPVPSGYDVPPDLSQDGAEPSIPVPSGYDMPPDLSGANAPQRVPTPSGYDVPDLDGGTETSLHEAPPAPTVRAADVAAAETTTPSRFQMKSMGQAYIDGEKNRPGVSAGIDGKETEVRGKEWLREKTNAERAAHDQQPLSEERWEEVWNEGKVGKTEYMSPERAAAHQVGFEEGTDANGQKNTKLAGDSIRPGQEHIFVMDGQGEVFAKEVHEANRQKEDLGRGVTVHHSSFKSGEAVAGAGALSVDEEGFLKEVTDRSGHYRPGEDQTTQTLEHLEKGKGVNLDNTKFTLDRGDERSENKTTGMAREYLQGQVTQEEIDHRQAKIDAGAKIEAKPQGQVEQTFKNRHNVADELKKERESVREELDREAAKRAGLDDDLDLGSDFELDGEDDLGLDEDAYHASNELGAGDDDDSTTGYSTPDDDALEQKPQSVRAALGGSLGNRQSQASNRLKT